MDNFELEEKEVLELVSELWPDWEKETRYPACGGKGKAKESVFAFSKGCNWYWIVYLCEKCNFAFQPVTPEWIKVYADLILLSPEIDVEFDLRHRITAWAAKQDKQCEKKHGY